MPSVQCIYILLLKMFNWLLLYCDIQNNLNIYSWQYIDKGKYKDRSDTIVQNGN